HEQDPVVAQRLPAAQQRPHRGHHDRRVGHDQRGGHRPPALVPGRRRRTGRLLVAARLGLDAHVRGHRAVTLAPGDQPAETAAGQVAGGVADPGVRRAGARTDGGQPSTVTACSSCDPASAPTAAAADRRPARRAWTAVAVAAAHSARKGTYGRWNRGLPHRSSGMAISAPNGTTTSSRPARGVSRRTRRRPSTAPTSTTWKYQSAVSTKNRRVPGEKISPLPIVSTAWMPSLSSAKISLDRKSTRLNSSHVKISYAVF